MPQTGETKLVLTAGIRSIAATGATVLQLSAGLPSAYTSGGGDITGTHTVTDLTITKGTHAGYVDRIAAHSVEDLTITAGTHAGYVDRVAPHTVEALTITAGTHTGVRDLSSTHTVSELTITAGTHTGARDILAPHTVVDLTVTAGTHTGVRDLIGTHSVSDLTVTAGTHAGVLGLSGSHTVVNLTITAGTHTGARDLIGTHSIIDLTITAGIHSGNLDVTAAHSVADLSITAGTHAGYVDRIGAHTVIDFTITIGTHSGVIGLQGTHTVSDMTVTAGTHSAYVDCIAAHTVTDLTITHGTHTTPAEGVSQFRVVYDEDQIPYLELNAATSLSFTVTEIRTQGWDMLAAVVDGSIPAGYSAETKNANDVGCGGGGGGIDGSGTAGYLPKWADSDTLEDSGLYNAATGKFGIGTASPSGILDIANIMSGAGGAANALQLGMFGNYTGYQAIYLRKSRGTSIGALAATTTNDVLGAIHLQGVNDSGAFDDGSVISARVRQNATSSVISDLCFEGQSGTYPTRYRFAVGALACSGVSLTNLLEGLHVERNGSVGITIMYPGGGSQLGALRFAVPTKGNVGYVSHSHNTSQISVGVDNNTYSVSVAWVLDATLGSETLWASGGNICVDHGRRYQLYGKSVNSPALYKASTGNAEVNLDARDAAGTNGYDLYLRTRGSGHDVFVETDQGGLIVANTTHEDADGGRECRISGQGEQSGGEQSLLGYMEFCHDGSSDDEKGQFRVLVNDGNDGTAPSVTGVTVRADGGIEFPNIPSGATQVAAGAGTNELWRTSSHATLPDNVVMIGA